MSLLEVDDLRVSFDTSDGVVRAVRGISFTVDRGQTLGIVGESGSGKSVTAATLLGLTPGARVEGHARFDGRDLLAMSDEQLRRIRGRQISMIFQDLAGLHPLHRVGRQLAEMIREHEPETSKGQARRRAVELLGMVGIAQPARRADDYPHQFSGGMRQRAMIAMALALNPRLIIADEPTTALDATVQAQILDLLRRLQGEFGTALIMITHDLGVIADLADEVLVMYCGKAVEYAERRTAYYQPHHPYTKGLLESIPGSAGAGHRLRPIGGRPPSLIHVPSGCSFHPRCAYAMDRCKCEEPPPAVVRTAAGEPDPGHLSACWLPDRAVGLGDAAEALRRDAAAAGRTPHETAAQSATPDLIDKRGEPATEAAADRPVPPGAAGRRGAQ